MKTSLMKYAVGALMYTPALNDKAADKIIAEAWGTKYSIAFCLEDTIAEEALQRAEETLIATLTKLKEAKAKKHFYMPMVFIRVRNPEQFAKFYPKLESLWDVVTGIIFPKYAGIYAENYNRVFKAAKEKAPDLWAMPILESPNLLNPHYLHNRLEYIDSKIRELGDSVLNIRLGGNDMCNVYGVRRHCNETIYDIKAIADLLSEIVVWFGQDYVISGVVWEYFSGATNEWKKGLEHEMQLDRLNGFLGKTVIHPNQIKVVNKCLKVSQEDYNDAVNILQLKDEKDVIVGRSQDGSRMNEAKTHTKWAEKILSLATIYGVA